MSPDGTRLACIRPDGGVGSAAAVRRDVRQANGGLRWPRRRPSGPSPSARTARGSSRAARIGRARLWDPATGALLATCRGHTSKVFGCRVQPGRRAPGDGLVGRDGAAVGRRDGPGGRTALRPPFRRGPHRRLQPGRAVGRLGGRRPYRPGVAGVRAGRTWRSCTATRVRVSRRWLSPRTAAGWPPSVPRRRLVSEGDGTVRVWDVDPRATLPVLRGHTRAIYPVAFSPDGRWLASGSWDSRCACGTRRPASRARPCPTPPSCGVWPSAPTERGC